MTTKTPEFLRPTSFVVESFRLERYDNCKLKVINNASDVVESFRLERYDNSLSTYSGLAKSGCRILSFGEV